MYKSKSSLSVFFSSFFITLVIEFEQKRYIARRAIVKFARFKDDKTINLLFLRAAAFIFAPQRGKRSSLYMYISIYPS